MAIDKVWHTSAVSGDQPCERQWAETLGSIICWLHIINHCLKLQGLNGNIISVYTVRMSKCVIACWYQTFEIHVKICKCVGNTMLWLIVYLSKYMYMRIYIFSMCYCNMNWITHSVNWSTMLRFDIMLHCKIWHYIQC